MSDQTKKRDPIGEATANALKSLETPAEGDQGPKEESKPGEPESKALKGKQIVRWGDADREVSIEELVALARKGEKADTVVETAKEMVARAAGAEKLLKIIEDLPEQDQRDFVGILQNPKEILAKLRGTKESDEDDEDLEELLGDQPKKRSTNGHDPEIAALKEQVQGLTRIIEEQQGERRQARLTEQIQEMMGAFPTAFGRNDALTERDVASREFILPHVLRALAADPKANMRDVIAEQAAGLEKVILNREVKERSKAPVSMDFGHLEPPKTITGRDMQSGKLLDRLLGSFK